MATRIDGDNILVPGQATVVGRPTALQHVITKTYVGPEKAYVTGLDLNSAAPADLSVVTINSGRYIPTRVYIYNPTANLAAATLGLYTAAGGGGTAVVTPVLLATLTAVDKFQQLSIAALTTVLSATTLYPRLTVASGVAGTASLVIEYIDLALI